MRSSDRPVVRGPRARAEALDPIADAMLRDAAITATMLELIDARAEHATICPSDVARALRPDDESAWRALMAPIRQVAAGLAAAGRVRVTRKGEPVDATAPGGPIRIGRPR